MSCFYAPTTKWGETYSFALVRTFVCTTVRHFVVLFNLHESTYSIWSMDLKLATQFRHALNMCSKETEIWSGSLLPIYVPLNDIHILTLFPCLTYSNSVLIAYFDHFSKSCYTYGAEIVCAICTAVPFLPIQLPLQYVDKTDSTCFCRIMSLLMT